MSVLLFVCVGAVFSDRLQADYEAAFRFAIDTINKGKSMLPNTELRVIVNKTATLDAFKNIEMGKWQIKPSMAGNRWKFLIISVALQCIKGYPSAYVVSNRKYYEEKKSGVVCSGNDRMGRNPVNHGF